MSNKLGEVRLSFTYSEHFSTACRAGALGGWPAILHSYSFSVFHFLFRAAFHAICLSHKLPPF